MAQIDKRTDTDDLVLRAQTDADALGQLYELITSVFFGFAFIGSSVRMLPRM